MTHSIAGHITAAFDPGLTPNEGGLPPGVVQWLREFGGGVLLVGFVIAAIALVISAVVWAVGSFGTRNQQMASFGGKGVLISVIAALVMGAGNRLIAWAGSTGSEIIATGLAHHGAGLMGAVGL